MVSVEETDEPQRSKKATMGARQRFAREGRKVATNNNGTTSERKTNSYDNLSCDGRRKVVDGTLDGRRRRFFFLKAELRLEVVVVSFEN
eukprot:scaffold2438_cov167-Amphora_coffeaeformis.AAC.25